MEEQIDMLVGNSMGDEVEFWCVGGNREVFRERLSRQLRREYINKRNRRSEHLQKHTGTDKKNHQYEVDSR